MMDDRFTMRDFETFLGILFCLIKDLSNAWVSLFLGYNAFFFFIIMGIMHPILIHMGVIYVAPLLLKGASRFQKCSD